MKIISANTDMFSTCLHLGLVLTMQLAIVIVTTSIGAVTETTSLCLFQFFVVLLIASLFTAEDPLSKRTIEYLRRKIFLCAKKNAPHINDFMSPKLLTLAVQVATFIVMFGKIEEGASTRSWWIQITAVTTFAFCFLL